MWQLKRSLESQKQIQGEVTDFLSFSQSVDDEASKQLKFAIESPYALIAFILRLLSALSAQGFCSESSEDSTN